MSEQGGLRYVLGHSNREHDRLDLQGTLYRDVTRRAFVDGGLRPGMRVLDLGSGSGDVALLAADLVGPTGHVVGLDRDPGTVAAATARAEARGATNVTFQVGDIEAPPSTVPFDALVGRFVLMHQVDPAAALRAALTAVHAGGVVAFVESSMTLLLEGIHSAPHSPLYDQVVRWKCAVVGAAGADLSAGMSLRGTFLDAGVQQVNTRLEAPLEGGPDSAYYGYVAESIRSMRPLADDSGIPGFDDAELATLEDRLRKEVTGGGGVVVAWPVVAAWGRVSAS